jgi:hypothetical protein
MKLIGPVQVVGYEEKVFLEAEGKFFFRVKLGYGRKLSKKSSRKQMGKVLSN